MLLKSSAPDAPEQFQRNAGRAKEWERKADELVVAAREAVQVGDTGAFFRNLVEAADDVADDLEEAAFHFTLLPDGAREERVRQPLLGLAALLMQGAQEYLKALETTRFVHRGAPREDVQDFLEAIHRITSVEHRTDDAQRGVKRALLQDHASDQALYVYVEAVKNLEQVRGRAHARRPHAARLRDGRGHGEVRAAGMKSTADTRRVFFIDSQSREQPAGDARAMGFKALNLARMAEIGLPVPQAFVLGTGFCREQAREDSRVRRTSWPGTSPPTSAAWSRAADWFTAARASRCSYPCARVRRSRCRA